MDDESIDGIISPYDSATSFGNPELMTQASRLARRKALLEADALQAAKQTGAYAPAQVQTVPGWTSAVTGTQVGGQVVKPSLLSSLSPLIANVGRIAQERQYDKDLSGYQRMEAQAAREHMAAMPRDVPAQPIEQTAPDGTSFTAYTAPQTADRQSKLEWARKAQTIPSLKSIGDAYLADLVVKEPEREELRAERQQTREEARAEAQRKQADELAYRRERDKEAAQLRRDIAQQNADLRRELHASIASGSGGKAADWKQETAEDGSISYYNVITGERKGSGGQGKPTAQFAKDRDETRNAIEQSNTILGEEKRVQELLGQASPTGLRATLNKKANYFTGYAPDALKADEALRPIAARYVQAVPKFSGPTSDADVREYKEAAANLANTELSPDIRKAAHKEVVRLTRKSLEQQRERSSFSGDSAARKRDNGANLNSGPRTSTSGDPLVDKYLNR